MDNLYFVRFSEILSAATIPIVYSGDWAVPYNREVVDWLELAICFPKSMSIEPWIFFCPCWNKKRAKRQQCILEFYNNYVADHGRLRAVLKQMDDRLNLPSSSSRINDESQLTRSFFVLTTDVLSLIPSGLCLSTGTALVCSWNLVVVISSNIISISKSATTNTSIAPSASNGVIFLRPRFIPPVFDEAW